jgi:hypothetical protein
VGYRFPNAGELLLSYQSVVSSGSELLSSFGGGPGGLTSRLNLNVVTFDWVSKENSFGPDWCMTWRGGVAIATGYLDNTATSAALDQRTSNYFIAGGVHGGLDLWRALPAPGWALYGRAEGLYMVGGVKQKEAETIVAPDGTVSSAAIQNTYIPAVNAYSRQVTPVVLTLEGGVSYTPPDIGHWLRLTAAYHFERWWALGNPIAQINGSDAGFIFQGIIFRAEITW